MIFSLEALEAKYGDSLILHFGTPQEPRFILIDGGPSGVFRSTLDRRLTQLEELRPGEPLRLDLLMISHIDEDHIQGILDLARDLIDQQDRGLQLSREISGLWHNSFDDIVGGPAQPTVASLASLPIGRPAALVVASVLQGRTLRNQAAALGWKVNRPFDQLVMRGQNEAPSVPFSGDLTLRVLGPAADRVEALQKEWDEQLRRRGLAQPDVTVAALLDQSVFNLSSIVVLAESGGKRMLLTGDARGDDILEGLQAAGLLEGGALHLDVLKMPHHGSIRNIDAGFLQRLTADHYVISANGKHGNPDIETLELLTHTRGADEYTINLTNRTGEDALEAKLSDFFQRDQASAQRRYWVNYRASEALSLSVNLGSDPHR